MTKQIQDAYIVSAVRTPVGKAPRGMFRTVRPDDMLAHVLTAAMKQCAELDPAAIDDVIVGCAMPEAEQGMNVARIALLLAGLPDNVAGMTINRFCSSGLQAVALAADRIRLGHVYPMRLHVPHPPPGDTGSVAAITSAMCTAGCDMPRGLRAGVIGPITRC